MLVYQENFASWLMEPSPKLAERFDRSTSAMVKRDRNHPSVVMWGVLNETGKGPVFARRAALPLSARSTTAGWRCSTAAAGTASEKIFANPGVDHWESTLADQHPYQPLPHNAAVINTLRTLNGGAKPVCALGIRRRQRRGPVHG